MASSADTPLQNLIVNEVDSESTLDDMVTNNQIQPNEFYMTPDETDGFISLPIGTIFASAVPQTSSAFHLLDGSTISTTGMYSQFATLLNNLVTAGYNISCTSAQYATDISTYGQCGKFVIDNTNHTIKLPTITKFIEGLVGITNIGTSYRAGVPNITGNLFLGWADASGGGVIMNSANVANSAVYHSRRSGKAFYTAGNSHSADGDLEFDASRSNPIYGRSNTVQPQSTAYPYYIVVANSYKTDIQVDIDQVASDINNVTSKIAKGIISFPDPTRYIDVTSSCQSLANALTTFYTPNFNGWLVFQTSSSDKTSSYQNCFQNTTMGIRIQTDFYHYASNAGGMIPFRAGDVLQYLKETNSTVNSVKLYYLVGDR